MVLAGMHGSMVSQADGDFAAKRRSFVSRLSGCLAMFRQVDPVSCHCAHVPCVPMTARLLVHVSFSFCKGTAAEEGRGGTGGSVGVGCNRGAGALISLARDGTFCFSVLFMSRCCRFRIMCGVSRYLSEKQLV